MNVHHRCRRHRQLILVMDFSDRQCLLTPPINIHSRISLQIKGILRGGGGETDSWKNRSWKFCVRLPLMAETSMFTNANDLFPSFPDDTWDRHCIPYRTGPSYIPQPILPFIQQGCHWCLVFTAWTMLSVVREGSITPRDGPTLPSSTSREGADMTAAGGRPSSRTTSAPTSPLKEKPRSSFLGKVTSLSQVRITV